MPAVFEIKLIKLLIIIPAREQLWTLTGFHNGGLCAGGKHAIV